MNRDFNLIELYMKRDDFYSRLLPRLIAIPLLGITFLLFTYWTIDEFRILVFGERIEVPIERLEGASDNYYLFVRLGGLTVKREIKKNTFDQLQIGSQMRIAYWDRNPRKSVFLELNERYDVLRAAIGLGMAGILLIGTIRRVRALLVDNPDGTS